MKIEDIRIRMPLYNNKEKLIVEIISKKLCYPQKVYSLDSSGQGWWFHSHDLSGKSNEWIDLGLKSGTLWKSDIERDDNGKPLYLNHTTAEKTYKNNLPKYWQLVELYEDCTWEWKNEKSGYKVTGPNGNSIFLPTAGYKEDKLSDDTLELDLNHGYYWSAMSGGPNTSHCLYISSIDISIQYNGTNPSAFTIILCK